MSDPTRSGYTCCQSDMQPITVNGIAGAAFLCGVDLVWRHGLPVGDPRRPDVVEAMEQLTRLMYLSRQSDES